MKFFRKLVMAIHSKLEGYICRKCGIHTNHPVSGDHCPKGGSHDWKRI